MENENPRKSLETKSIAVTSSEATSLNRVQTASIDGEKNHYMPFDQMREDLFLKNYIIFCKVVFFSNYLEHTVHLQKFSAPCQKPVIERFERKDLPTGGDSATTQRMD